MFLYLGIKISESFGDTQAFKSIGATLPDQVHPSCKHLEPKSDDYYECFAKENAFTAFHPTSTCKMGPDGDPEAVVDIRLRSVVFTTHLFFGLAGLFKRYCICIFSLFQYP